jgi:aminoglycoside phosphotransferase (APT) family kinase protein
MAPDAAQLEGCLRTALEDPDLELRGDPTSLGRGGDADAWALRLRAPRFGDRDVVLRILHRHGSSAVLEGVVQNHVADAGFPAIRSWFATDDPALLGAPFAVIERARGRPLLGRNTGLLDALRDGRRLGPLLAGLELRLHALDAAILLDECARSGAPVESLSFEPQWCETQSTARSAGIPALAALADWLETTRPGPPKQRVICHCDLNPENVFVDAAGNVTHVIDWTATRVHEPELPAGILRAGLLTLTVGPPLVAAGARPLLRRTARAYLKARLARSPLDARRVRWYEAFTCSWLLARSFRGEARSPWPWQGERGRRGVARHLARLGVPEGAYRL